MSAPLPPLPAPDVADVYEKSAETLTWLRENVKIGFTSERGPAWWADGARTKDGVWEMPEGSHFEGPVPMEIVAELLDRPFAKGAVNVVYEDEAGQRQVATDEKTQPIVDVRTGRIFSYPKAGYRIHPYLITLNGFIESIQYDQAAVVGSVGLLKSGGQAFLQARLPETLEVAGYPYAPYILAVTSVDMSRATSYSTGFLAAVCDNTLDAAILNALTKLKIKHTRNSVLSVQYARDSLGVKLAEAGEEIGAAIDKLTGVGVSDRDFAAWLDEIQPAVEKDPKSSTGGRAFTYAENKRERLTQLYTEDEKVAPWAGTAFGILQLANTDTTWNGIVRNAEGGRIERVFSNVASGMTAKSDAAAMDALAKVLDRKAVLA